MSEALTPINKHNSKQFKQKSTGSFPQTSHRKNICDQGRPSPPTARKQTFPPSLKRCLSPPIAPPPQPGSGVRGCHPRKIFENQDARTCILMHFGMVIPIIKF